MARQREFDREEVLDRALEAFWARGYEATSIQELVDCMGLQRGSLYNTFGDKHGLFVAACVANTFGRVEAAFHRVLSEAQTRGELDARHDARALARFLTSSLQGIRVMTRAGTAPAVLRDVVRVTLTTLTLPSFA